MAAQLASGAVTIKRRPGYVPQYNIVRDISAFHRILL